MALQRLVRGSARWLLGAHRADSSRQRRRRAAFFHTRCSTRRRRSAHLQQACSDWLWTSASAARLAPVDLREAPEAPAFTGEPLWLAADSPASGSLKGWSATRRCGARPAGVGAPPTRCSSRPMRRSGYSHASPAERSPRGYGRLLGARLEVQHEAGHQAREGEDDRRDVADRRHEQGDAEHGAQDREPRRQDERGGSSVGHARDAVWSHARSTAPSSPGSPSNTSNAARSPGNSRTERPPSKSRDLQAHHPERTGQNRRGPPPDYFRGR